VDVAFITVVKDHVAERGGNDRGGVRYRTPFAAEDVFEAQEREPLGGGIPAELILAAVGYRGMAALVADVGVDHSRVAAHPFLENRH
jgi:hypothetical protein